MTHTQKSDPRWSLKWLGTPGCRTQTCVIGEWMRYLKKSRPKRKGKRINEPESVARAAGGSALATGRIRIFSRAARQTKRKRGAKKVNRPLTKQSAVAADAHYDASPTSTLAIVWRWSRTRSSPPAPRAPPSAPPRPSERTPSRAAWTAVPPDATRPTRAR